MDQSGRAVQGSPCAPTAKGQQMGGQTWMILKANNPVVDNRDYCFII